MNYEELEDDIAGKIMPLAVDGVDVMVMPEKEADYKRPFKKAKVTVSIGHSKAGKPETTSVVAQWETICVDLTLEARFLRGDDGIYRLKKKVTDLIIGYRPPNYSRLIELEFRFEQYTNGIYTYTLTVTTTALLVQSPDAENFPNISQITMGEVVVTSPGAPEQDENNIITAPAGEQLISYYPVAIINGLAVPYDASNLDHVYAYAGFVVNSPMAAEVAMIKINGYLQGGSWVPNQLYYAKVGGGITTDPEEPGAAFNHVVGRGVTSTTFLIFDKVVVETI